MHLIPIRTEQPMPHGMNSISLYPESPTSPSYSPIKDRMPPAKYYPRRSFESRSSTASQINSDKVTLRSSVESPNEMLQPRKLNVNLTRKLSQNREE